jgi:hypothetical protein
MSRTTEEEAIKTSGIALKYFENLWKIFQQMKGDFPIRWNAQFIPYDCSS